LPRSRRLDLAAGITATEQVSLLPLDRAVALEYPYPPWIPWTAAASGAAIGLVGLGVWWRGRRDMERFDAAFAKMYPQGTLLSDSSLESQHDRAARKGTIGIAMMTIGGAIAVGGLVFAILDRPRKIVPVVESTSSGPTVVGVGGTY
jgi:hypothetical protein